MTPRASETAFMPASLPGVSFTRLFYIGECELFYDRRADGLVHDLCDRQPFFGALDLVPLRLGGRMTRRKERAAVLVGDDGNRIRAKPLCLGGDFFLVHPDERAEARHPPDAA